MSQARLGIKWCPRTYQQPRGCLESILSNLYWLTLKAVPLAVAGQAGRGNAMGFTACVWTACRKNLWQLRTELG